MSPETPLDDLIPGLAVVQQLARLEERMQLGGRLRAVAIILETPESLDWAHRLDDARVVAVVGPTAPEDTPAIVDALRSGRTLPPDVLVLDLRATMTEAALALVTGETREVAVLGARGDGKSVGAVIAWLLYAARHQAQGGTWPVRVLVPTTSMVEHRDKLCRTLVEPPMLGLLRSEDDEHLWIVTLGGVEVLHLILFGVKDTTEQDRLRQAAHGLWVEEAAPAGVEATGGLDEAALGVGITSLRLPSYHHPVLVTSNYGSESHWTWQRYAVRQQPGSQLFRITPGERASAADRAAWMEALDGRPDLQQRLVLGEPALIVAGQGVLEGVWNPAVHVSREPLAPIRGARTVLGHDFGLRPCTVVVQEHRGQVRVLASLVTEYGGTAQHIPGVVLPWLGRCMPWLLEGGRMEHAIDPAGAVGDQGDVHSSPERQIKRFLGGAVHLGPDKWPPRIEPLLAALGRMVGGQPVLLVAPGPDTAVLREACAGRWYYARRADGQIVRELPEKTHPHSDAGDSLCYAVARLAPGRAPKPPGWKPTPSKIAFDERTGQRVLSDHVEGRHQHHADEGRRQPSRRYPVADDTYVRPRQQCLLGGGERSGALHPCCRPDELTPWAR